MKTDFFDNIAGVLQGDIFVYNLPRPCTTNIDRSNKWKCLYSKKKKKQEADNILQKL